MWSIDTRYNKRYIANNSELLNGQYPGNWPPIKSSAVLYDQAGETKSVTGLFQNL